VSEQNNPPSKLLLTVEEVAKILNLSRSKLYNSYLLTGDLPSLKLGRRRLIRVQAVHEFVERLELRSRGEQES
jgi:excisionase family DNA binding protein